MSIAAVADAKSLARAKPRQRSNLAAILADHGVTIVPPTEGGRGQRAAGKNCAGATLQRILDQHGERHLRDVLVVILQSEGNELALVAPIITAVSATLLGHPAWYARNAGLFLEVVDRVNLLELHSHAKRNRRARGERVMVFAHGFGCDQNMWRFVAPAFEADFRTVLFDHVGAGRSDLAAYDPRKYASLNGYADDVVEIGRALGLSDAVFVGFGQRDDRGTRGD